MIVGLTGGIGSGKTTIAKLFATLGCVIINSDELAKEVYYEPSVEKKVKALLGEQSYLHNKAINKDYISNKIFSNTDLLKKLNAIIHPEVIARSKQFVNNNPGKIIIKESALLFEAHLENEVNKNIVVVADEKTRIERAIARDHISREEVLKKIQSQLSQDEKIKKSDYVIYNDENQLVIPQVISVFEKLKRA